MKMPLNRLVFQFLRPYWGWLFLVILLQFGATIAGLELPRLNAEIIDNGVSKGDTAYIWSHGGIMLAVSAAQVLCQILAVFFGARLAMSFGRDVRGRLFKKVLSFSAREVNKFGAPSLITRNTNDVQQVQMLVLMSCIIIFGAPITMVGGVVMAIRTSWGLSWIILAAVVLLGVLATTIILKMGPLFKSMQTRIDTVNRVLRERITGIRVVRAFVREPYEAERFGKANADLMDVGVKVGRLMMTMFPLVMFILNISTVAVMWFGAKQISAMEMEIGGLTAFITYLMQILMSVMMATMMVIMVPRAAVCAERIMEVFDQRSTVVPAEKPVTELTGEGRFAFENVAFRYAGAAESVISGITFAMEPGQTTAIIGSTGSGKTTLVNLVPRLYDATEGVVSLDGVDIREIDEQLLWSKIGLIPQKPYLFTGTVASNLRYGNPDATDEELWYALEVAQAKDFVSEMPGKLEEPISQGGTNVSGGQRQRLSIARALVKKPDIYIFDDSFSALDVATDARLRAALHEETDHAVVMIVAQRVSTIRNADRILVLDDGGIVGDGTHDELLANCPTYQEIVESQMTAEEALA
ncbi:MAG: ABC transporter ATP-binding protein/permease [Propionibacteriaceae bacterium]|jgi:ATP-binding cassette subfamily B protein|nr:ABC transporter ATP-binding protein/permease [Propionibacteriaceae bacterium]